jgi:hypothetical protein
MKNMPQKTISLDAVTTAKLEAVLTTYEELRDAFVDYDTIQVDSMAYRLVDQLANFTFEGIQDSGVGDSLAVQLKGLAVATKAIGSEKMLEGKKRHFSEASDFLYSLLQAAQFDQSVIYRQTCPMAFNDSETASWVSRSSEILNPYLGKKHPKYASGMLHCGEVTDSVHFTK